jgi:hypothetical protein
MEDITTKIVEIFINDKINYSILTTLDEIYTNIDPIEQQKLNKILIHDNKIESFKVNLKVLFTDDINEDALQLIKIDTNRKCLARTPKGKQCIRYKFEGSDYCGIHIKDRVVKPEPPIKERKRRAPNKKTIDDIDVASYIKATVMNINNNNYLVDEYGIVFSNDRENLIVGYISEDTVNWIT